jgi:hypothetical protein
MKEDRMTAQSAATPLIEIDQQAPVVGASEIEIAATAETVWGVLTAIDQWPDWNPDVKSASMRGPLAEGTVFRWKAGPGAITSTIRRIEPLRLIAWTGKTLGIDAIHAYRLEAQEGKTLVRTEESYQGLVARLLRRSLQKTLDRALVDGLRFLKNEAERRTRR